jgi:8-oxo-dGTP diphosphatase
VARRAEKANRGGMWEFPGGKVASGETEAECLRREIREEMGTVVQVADRLRPVLYREPDRTIRLIPYLCIILRGSPKPLEHERIHWAGAGELVRLVWCPADIAVVRQYLILRAPWLVRELDQE